MALVGKKRIEDKEKLCFVCMVCVKQSGVTMTLTMTTHLYVRVRGRVLSVGYHNSIIRPY